MRDIGQDVGISDITCSILRAYGQEFNGVASCSAQDNICAESGRKLRLKSEKESARGKVELDAVVRYCIWQRYFGRHIPNQEFYVLGENAYGPIAVGVIDPQYERKAGSDDLVNQA